MKKLYLFLFIIIIPFLLTAQVPAPDAWYTFDETSGTQITDSSGNDYHAYWFNWNDEDPGTAARTGWRPAEGYRGGAGYFAGDHVDCEQSCSSGSDLLVFSAAGSGADCMADMPVNNLFQSGFTDMTLTFWFKNDWNYLCDVDDPNHTCGEDPGDCAWERAVLWSAGDGSTGLTVVITPGALYPSLVKATINSDTNTTAVTVTAFHEPVQNKEWVHFAIVFDGDEGAGTGELRVYLDNVMATPQATAFATISADDAAVVFGGETENSVSGFNVTGHCWGSVDDKYPGCPKPEWVGTVRYGWPARGWIDELAYWKDKALTQEEIAEFARAGDTTGTNLVNQLRYSDIDVYPTLTEGYISVRNLDQLRSYQAVIINTLGQKVRIVSTLKDDQRILLDGLEKGLYMICIRDEKSEICIRKFIIW
jgi:hypothetical protein